MSRIVRAQRVNVCTDADLERLATQPAPDLYPQRGPGILPWCSPDSSDEPDLPY